uniref:DUF4177 domain-containing protein n=1 Tax=Sphingobacterium sp. (strain 21) TaxID=743722 RepID=F4C455_SPHS2
MMKIILFVFILLPYVAFSQQQSLPRTEQYCMVLAHQPLLSTKVKVSIDFGQEVNIWRKDWIKNEEGKIVKFNSVIDALNYMNSEGWDFVNAYAITIGNQNVYHYVMKRKITSEILQEMTDNVKKAEEIEAKKKKYKDDVYGR